MKPKDLICYVGAPFRTVVETGVLGGVITGAVLGLAWLINHFTIAPWWLALIGNILLYLMLIISGGAAVFAIAYLLWWRTKYSYDQCKEFWNKD